MTTGWRASRARPRCAWKAVLVGIVALVGAGVAPAQVPGTMNFQGLLLYPSGAKQNGSVTFVFELFAAETGGAPLWTETLSDVPVLDGVYDVVLGATTPLTTIVSQNATLFLQITVDNGIVGPEVLAPRRQLLVVPYAIRAETASTANVATTAVTAAHATSADSADTALDVGGVSAEFIAQVYQYADFDGNGLLNSDPIEGLADIDADGLAGFIDPDNDGDGLSDATEISQGSNPNGVPATLTGFSPPTLVEWAPGSVTVSGTGFDLLVNPTVTFGLNPAQTPINVTPTSFQVSVPPQSVGSKQVVISSSNGDPVIGSFEFVDNPAVNPVIAFVTSTTYTGNLGGLTGADTACQDRATAAGLVGTYKAWIRTASDITRVTSNWGSNFFVLRNGTELLRFALNYGDLTSRAVHIPPFNMTESGLPAEAPLNAWTGGGSIIGGAGNCNNWTAASSGSGRTGIVGTPHWQNAPEMQCSIPARLYCFRTP